MSLERPAAEHAPDGEQGPCRPRRGPRPHEVRSRATPRRRGCSDRTTGAAQDLHF